MTVTLPPTFNEAVLVTPKLLIDVSTPTVEKFTLAGIVTDPGGPVAPVMEAVPAGPVGPKSPVGPVAPVMDAVPGAPVFPVYPVGPVAPDSPVILMKRVWPVVGNVPVAPNILFITSAFPEYDDTKPENCTDPVLSVTNRG